MEIINRMASAAAKSVWGTDENKKEPPSGVQGDASKGEPFDGGNMEPKTATTETESGGPEDSSREVGDSTKAQNDTHAPSDPQTKPENSDAAVNVDGTGKSAEVEGPGPRPIAEVVREHGGDAGNTGGAVSCGTEDGSQDEEGDGDAPQKESHGGPAGEKYVKSSGLKADGGDFDAANPGAGREAERLMEEKGVHKDGHRSSPEAASPTTDGKSGTKEKKSLGEKIRAKFHKGTAS